MLPVILVAQGVEPGRAADNPGNNPRAEEAVVERRVGVRDGDERTRGGDRDRQSSEREAIERHLMELHEQAADLHKNGNHEEAGQVEREIREIENQRRDTDRPGGVRPSDRRNEDEVVELQRRLNHLRIAGENLHAAGLHGMAREVEQQAAETRGRLEDHARRGRPALEVPREELERLRREIAELRQQLEEMRHDQPRRERPREPKH